MISSQLNEVLILVTYPLIHYHHLPLQNHHHFLLKTNYTSLIHRPNSNAPYQLQTSLQPYIIQWDIYIYYQKQSNIFIILLIKNQMSNKAILYQLDVKIHKHDYLLIILHLLLNHYVCLKMLLFLFFFFQLVQMACLEGHLHSRNLIPRGLVLFLLIQLAFRKSRNCWNHYLLRFHPRIHHQIHPQIQYLLIFNYHYDCYYFLHQLPILHLIIVVFGVVFFSFELQIL